MGRDFEEEVGVCRTECFAKERSLLNTVLDQRVSPVKEGVELIQRELADCLKGNVKYCR